ncbi:MAG: hypothetical protein MK214_08180, partial [Thalassotalea sp.]|nr:hypothetical protein [Thalassotalea sp.]
WIAVSSCHLLALVSAFGKVKLFFGEIIITDPIAVYFSYRKDQHALVKDDSLGQPSSYSFVP